MSSVEMENKTSLPKNNKKKDDDKSVAEGHHQPDEETKQQHQQQQDQGAEEKKALPPGDTRDIIEQFKVLFLGSKINVLLIFVPLSFVTSGAIQFICSFLGLMPLAAMLGDLVEDVAKRTNDTISALLSVTFGNATELIISIVALRTSNLDLVKYSLVGSILGNSTLVLGSAIVMAGYKRKLVVFNDIATQVYASGSSLAVFAYVTATTLAYEEPASDSDEEKQAAVLAVSRIISLLLIVIYFAYLFFTQESHKHLFDGAARLEDEDKKKHSPSSSPASPSSPSSPALESDAAARSGAEGELGHGRFGVAVVAASLQGKKVEIGDEAKKKAESADGGDDDGDDDDDEPEYSLLFAVAGTAIVTVVVSFLSEYLVESMQPAVEALRLSRAFVGIILVPIAGNVVEHGSALIVASHGRMDLAIGIALGSSLQIAMLVYPLTVLVGMLIGVPLDLGLPMFLLGALVLSSILVYMLTASGHSTWLGGAKLVAVFVILTAALLFAHDPKVLIAGTKPAATSPKTDL